MKEIIDIKKVVKNNVTLGVTELCSGIKCNSCCLRGIRKCGEILLLIRDSIKEEM